MTRPEAEPAPLPRSGPRLRPHAGRSPGVVPCLGPGTGVGVSVGMGMGVGMRRGRGTPARRAGRIGVALLVLAAGLVLLIGACEWAGWPFLAGPAERATSRLLERRVQWSPMPGAAESPRLHLIGALSVKAPRIEIGAPAWSREPYFLRADDVDLRITYGALWRAWRGEPLDIAALRARTLDLRAERRIDGSASWQFGAAAARPNRAATAAWRLPRIGALAVDAGTLRLDDAPFELTLDASLRLDEVAAARAGTRASGGQAASASASPPAASPSPAVPAGARGLVISAHGRYRGLPVNAGAASVGLQPLLGSDGVARPVPVAMRLRVGRAGFGFQGTVTDPLHLTGLTGSFGAAGPSLAAVGDPLGVTLPSTGAFALRGRLAKTGEVWNVVTDDATVGASRLEAALTYDTGPDVPVLAGRVGGARFLLVDLLPALGVATVPIVAPVPLDAPPPPTRLAPRPAGARTLPDREFDLPSLRAMDADVQLAFDRAELGRLFALPLQPLQAHLGLRGGRLTIDHIDARTADGSLAGTVTLDATAETARWTSDLRWNGVRLERWLNQPRRDPPSPYITGRLNGGAKLQGQGRSTAQILGSLDGNVWSTLADGRLSHLAIEAAGLDVAQALGVMVSGDKLLAIDCAIVDLEARHGVLRPRTMVVDTSDSTLWMDGSLSLANESLDLRAIVHPKDFSPMTLRSPLHVRGSFSQPEVSVERGTIAAKLAASALLALVNPLAALIPLVDTGDPSAAPPACAALSRRLQAQARAPAASNPAPPARRNPAPRRIH